MVPAGNSVESVRWTMAVFTKKDVEVFVPIDFN